MAVKDNKDNKTSQGISSDEREKILNRLGGGMADSSSLVISVAVGLLGILALYEFSPNLTSASWVLLSLANWIIFLFGLQIFAFHQVNFVLYNRYARHEPYRKLTEESRRLAQKLWLSRIVWKAYVPQKENLEMDDFSPNERLFANMTVLFYFFVALIMWVAIAILS